MSEVGETLRERRMALKIDVHEVEEATKIRAKYLRALENEEYELLPGSAYVRSFLRTYAEYLDLDPRQLVDQYRAQGHRTPDDPLARPVAVQSSARRPRWVLIAAMLLALVVAAVLVWLLLAGGG
jgi:cytoskeletal protein RodZ